MLSAALRLASLLVLACLVVPAAARSQDSADDERAALVKAGMTLNFIRYTDWPEGSFESPASPIVVGVLGDGPIRPHLEEALRGQQAHDRPIEVRRLTLSEPSEGEPITEDAERAEYRSRMRGAHVLFICESERDRARAVARHLRGIDTLTVSDTKDFAERGGMLALVIRRGKVAIDANLAPIQATRLKVSSHLLRLAKTVHTEEP